MSAHTQLTPTDGSGQMFDRIAQRYDLLNRLMSMGLDVWWRRQLVRTLKLGKKPRVLDVATGTADVALSIARKHQDSTIVGLDPSRQMLDVGDRKINQAKLAERITLIEGDAQSMPMPADCFDAACVSFGIRNVPDRVRGLAEMARVVKPGGRVVVLELGEPRDGLLGPLVRWHVHHLVPWLGARLSGADAYKYLQQSIAAFPPPAAFAYLMREAGLENVHCKRLSFGAVHLFWGTVPEA
jgi:demethylmenaquinone methyltransferase / 2-methoxy-6-polyprenyl-1,4-benzoquinol methylase